MGMLAPEPGEFVRIVLELKGRRGLEQEDYDAFKAEIARIAKTHGAKVTAGEHVKIADRMAGNKKPRKKKR
jgi:hypothetical protein